MIRMNVPAFLDLQGDISDAEFARRLGVSRSQLWRIRGEKSAVGGNFIEKFMIAYPDMPLNANLFCQKCGANDTEEHGRHSGKDG